MIRKLTGLFAKLIDKSEEIIVRDDDVLDDLITSTAEIMTMTDKAPTFEEFSEPYDWDSGIRWDCFYWE